jgi:hypothetical protein
VYTPHCCKKASYTLYRSRRRHVLSDLLILRCFHLSCQFPPAGTHVGCSRIRCTITVTQHRRLCGHPLSGTLRTALCAHLLDRQRHAVGSARRRLWCLLAIILCLTSLQQRGILSSSLSAPLLSADEVVSPFRPGYKSRECMPQQARSAHPLFPIIRSDGWCSCTLI